MIRVFRNISLTVLIVCSIKAASLSQGNDPLSISTQFIFMLHHGQSTQKVTKQLAQLPVTFVDSFESSIAKKVFWVNLYNAFLVGEVRKDTSVLNDSKFWKDRRFVVAGTELSLNDIEYLILNRGKRKNGKDKWFVRKKYKSLMIDSADRNIFYLLYRGIAEGPPVRYIDASSYRSAVTLGKNYYFTQLVVEDRTTCSAPGFTIRYAPLYFDGMEQLTAMIRTESGCDGNLILFSNESTPDAYHFFPRYLR